jgi:hypothetical protein
MDGCWSRHKFPGLLRFFNHSSSSKLVIGFLALKSVTICKILMTDGLHPNYSIQMS